MSRIEEALNRAARENRSADEILPQGTRHAVVLEDYPREAGQPVAVPAASPHAANGFQATPETFAAPPLRETANVKIVSSADASPLLVEQYRKLAATLHEAQCERRINALMISSALPREGKSLTATNLALTLADSYQQRVLLIDADLRAPVVHSLFRTATGPGLADYLAGTTSRLPVCLVSPRLSVMPAGQHHGNPIAGLVSERMGTLIRQAREAYDWVLVDTPPVGLLPDASLVAHFMDGVLFVVAAASSPYPVVQRAIAQIGPERVIGVVLNRAEQDVVPNSEHYGYYEPR